MANKRISELASASALDGTELVEVVQGLVNKKTTAQDIADLAGASGGTVTSFSAGNLSPLFTTSVANATTTPALSFAQVNQNANLVFAGPTNGAAAAPTFRSLVAADIPSLSYVSSVSGTANRITSSGGLTPVIDIAATYVGQTSITTLGTITTGTWTGSVIGSSYGGAGAVNGILKADGLGVVSAAVAGTDYLTPSGSGAGLSGVWLLASGGTLSGANTVTLTTTNSLTLLSAALGTSVTPSFLIRNATAASAGAQQYSPTRRIEGQGWKTNATAASQSVWFDETLVPVQGAAAPTGTYQLRAAVNGSTTTIQYNISTDGGRFTFAANGLQILTSGGGVGGLSFNGSAPTGGVITMTPGSFAISTAATWNATGNGIQMNVGSSVNATSGTQNFVNFAGSFVPTSGTAAANFWNFSDIVNQTGGANGQVTGLNLAPVFTACAAFTAYNYDPTTPANITGAHYGVRIVPTTAYSAFGLGTPTALVHIGAVTTARASLCINPGATTTAPSAPVSGDIWHEGTGNRLMFRQGGTSTEIIATSAVSSVSPTAQNRTITVLLNNTTYYITAKTTND